MAKERIKIAGLLILIIGLMYYSITSKVSTVYIMFVIAVLSFLLGKYYDKLNRESRTSGEETGFNSSPPRFNNSPIPTLDDEN